MITSEIEFDSNLNRLDSLLNLPTIPTQEIGFDDITTGVFGATDNTTGIEAGVNVQSNLSYLQSRNFVSGSTGWRFDSNGDLEADSGTFRGTITATTGTIGGWTINATSIYTGTEDHSGYTANAGDITIYSDGNDASIHAKNFYIDTTGIIYCAGAVIDGTSTIGGRLASVLNTAIDASGHFADSAISTATNTIIGDFTFTPTTGGLQIGTYVNGVSGDIRISSTGILGRDNAGATTFSINGTTGVAVLNGLVVGTNVGLGTAQDSAGVTTIVGNTVTTGYVNALGVTVLGTVTAGTLATNVLIVGTNVVTAESRFNALFTKGCFIGSKDDGLTETGTVTRSLLRTTMSLSAAGSSLSSVALGTSYGGIGDVIGFNKDIETVFVVEFGSTGTQDVFLGLNDQQWTGATLPDDATSVKRHIGFWVQDATLYASNADNTTQTRTEITGVTITNENTYRFVFDAGTNIKFYVNDVLKATHTTNLPTAGNAYIMIGGDNGGAAPSLELGVYNNYFVIVTI